jgi:hypothetical protein
MSQRSRSCLFCGITEAEVIAVRKRDGYTLGCGIETNTENGFDYDELSPRHRWAPWRDNELDRMGLKPEAFDRYRTTIEGGIRYAPCDDTKRGHFYPTHSDSDEFGMPLDRCWGCGTPAPAVPSTTEQENS